MTSASKFSTWTFVILLMASLVLVVRLLFGFLTPVVMALVIVSIFYPMHQKIVKFVGNRESFAAFLSTMLVIFCVLGPLILFLMSLVQQALSIYQTTQMLKESGGIARWMASLNEYLHRITDYLAGHGIHITTEPIIKLAMSISQSIGNGIYDIIGTIAANLVILSFNLILMLVLVFVFFANGRSVKNFGMDLVPIPYAEKERLVNRFRELASAVFLGTGLISFLEGMFGAIIFLIFDIPGALIWAVFMAITAFVPVLGASVVVIPAAIYLFLVTDAWRALLFAALNIIHISILETVVKARLIGNKSQMHAVLVFLSILSGIQLYGIAGLFYGPLLVTIFLSLTQIYKEHYRSVLLDKRL